MFSIHPLKPSLLPPPLIASLFYFAALTFDRGAFLICFSAEPPLCKQEVSQQEADGSLLIRGGRGGTGEEKMQQNRSFLRLLAAPILGRKPNTQAFYSFPTARLLHALCFQLTCDKLSPLPHFPAAAAAFRWLTHLGLVSPCTGARPSRRRRPSVLLLHGLPLD